VLTHLDLCAGEKKADAAGVLPWPAAHAMGAHVVPRVMLLRETLKRCHDADEVQDLLQKANVLMRMALQAEVSIDLSRTDRQDTLMAKVRELVETSQGIRDDALKARVVVHLHSILSACVSSCLCSASAQPNHSDAMSADDKVQHVRASLLSSLQT
jgi:hypothetical protein